MYRTYIFHAAAAAGFLLATMTGCIPAPQENVPTPEPARELVETKTGAAFYHEAGVDDALWLEVDRSAEAGGPIGGYFTRPDGARDSIVLLMKGANPGGPEMRLPHTLSTHRSLGWAFVQAGFATWTPFTLECGIPYGQEDLGDTLAMIDWLNGPGKADLNVNRLYVVGYSKGATLATLANLHRPATAYVALNGLADPSAIAQSYLLYQLATTLFPINEGFCQMQSTLTTYGPPGSPGWAAIDAVSRIASLHSPQLFIHVLGDPVYPAQSTRSMRDRYEAGLAAGENLAPLEFIFLDSSNHFQVRTDPFVHQQIIDYLMRFELAP